jgi:hypothetical protein
VPKAKDLARTFISILLAGVAITSASAARATTYDLLLAAYGATGTVTTDGKIGILTASDIINWNITIQDSRGNAFDLTGPLSGGNSYLVYPGQYLSPGDLIATRRGLYWAFSASDDENFLIVTKSDPPCLCYFLLYTSYNQNQLFISLYDSNQFALQYYALPDTDLIGRAVP